MPATYAPCPVAGQRPERAEWSSRAYRPVYATPKEFVPAIARWIEGTPSGVAWLGFFYGGNTAGAVLGALFAGFYLLRQFDLSTATYVAAVLNATVAGLAFALSKGAPDTAEIAADVADAPRAELMPFAWAVYVAIGLSGLCALGAMDESRSRVETRPRRERLLTLDPHACQAKLQRPAIPTFSLFSL